MTSSAHIPTITVNQNFVSTFSEEAYPRHTRGGMILTDRIDVQNLRLRESDPGYQTDWHVAGDPTLIIVQRGSIRLTLQSGEYMDFAAGDAFIASDYLPEHIEFNNKIHGHRAGVLGDEAFLAVHIKLGEK